MVNSSELKFFPSEDGNRRLLPRYVPPDKDVLVEVTRLGHYKGTSVIQAKLRDFSLEGIALYLPSTCPPDFFASHSKYKLIIALQAAPGKMDQIVINETQLLRRYIHEGVTVVVFNIKTLSFETATGLMMLLRREEGPVRKTKLTREDLTNILKAHSYSRPYISPLVISSSQRAFYQVLGKVYPLIGIIIFDIAIPTKNLSIFINCMAVYISLMLIRFLMQRGFGYLDMYLSERVTYDASLDYFKKLQYMDHTYFETRNVGMLRERFRMDALSVSNCISSMFPAILPFIVTTVFMLWVTFHICWSAAALMILLSPLFYVTNYFLSKLSIKITARSRKNVLENANLFQEILSGIKLVKIFRAERYYLSKYMKILISKIELAFKGFGISSLQGFSRIILKDAVSAGIFIYLCFLLFSDRITLGHYIAMTAYLPQLGATLTGVAGFYQGFLSNSIDLASFFHTLSSEPAVKEIKDPVILSKCKGEVELRNVYFEYLPVKPILQKANMHIQPGERVAIIGPSGSGKSTLVSLLARLYDPVVGEILLDGVNLRHISFDSLRKHVAILLQENIFLRGTIRESIAFGQKKLLLETIQEAARKSYAHEFICTFPEGYDTDIGEQASVLSGGQKQRIALARMFLLNPQVLILDEPTNAIDKESEKLIFKSLHKHFKDKTIIFVTHSYNQLFYADRIFRIEKGLMEEVCLQDIIQPKNTHLDK